MAIDSRGFIRVHRSLISGSEALMEPSECLRRFQGHCMVSLGVSSGYLEVSGVFQWLSGSFKGFHWISGEFQGVSEALNIIETILKSL